MLRRLRQAEQLEILEVRRALEVESARLAATRRTDEDILRIEAALAERDRAWELDDPDAFVEADLAFHMSVAHATHNLVLIDLYEDFSAALRASITAAGTSLNKSYIPHDAIARAIPRATPPPPSAPGMPAWSTSSSRSPRANNPHAKGE